MADMTLESGADEFAEPTAMLSESIPVPRCVSPHRGCPTKRPSRAPESSRYRRRTTRRCSELSHPPFIDRRPTRWLGVGAIFGIPGEENIDVMEVLLESDLRSSPPHTENMKLTEKFGQLHIKI